MNKRLTPEAACLGTLDRHERDAVDPLAWRSACAELLRCADTRAWLAGLLRTRHPTVPYGTWRALRRAAEGAMVRVVSEAGGSASNLDVVLRLLVDRRLPLPPWFGPRWLYQGLMAAVGA